MTLKGSRTVVRPAKADAFSGSQSRQGKSQQTPPDLVVKFQPVDIVDIILCMILQPHGMYQREITG